MGRVPEAGESVERDGLRMEVLGANELRVEQVRVSKSGTGREWKQRKRVNSLRASSRLSAVPMQVSRPTERIGRERLAIVADKPQTTRTNVQGIWNTPEAQVIFLDTPGIHKADTLYNRRMIQDVRSALDERDLPVHRRCDAELYTGRRARNRAGSQIGNTGVSSAE